ncbi:hypothetical protein JJE66_33680 [Bradyrhizobium diazoefficiens]|uniref:hypothetical protein n=1 Tax=Bradyrhizobium diazoefficiens TaxID=1355477 RepID=UPI00190B5598|nr:hypothetical protein [Bradyrhizobium diazoefficiens]MBK3666159.1 hypothetical protein [Bradyrhizobium diazoefficiens]
MKTRFLFQSITGKRIVRDASVTTVGVTVVKSMERKEREELRQLVSQLVAAGGCSCCRDDDAYFDAREKLGKILKVSKYSDGTGYNFYKYARAVV